MRDSMASGLSTGKNCEQQTKSVNQVDQLMQENKKLHDLIREQEVELLNLYRQLTYRSINPGGPERCY